MVAASLLTAILQGRVESMAQPAPTAWPALQPIVWNLAACLRPFVWQADAAAGLVAIQEGQRADSMRQPALTMQPILSQN